MEATRRPAAEVDIDDELPSYLDVLNDIPPVPEGVNTSMLEKGDSQPSQSVVPEEPVLNEAPPSYEEVISPAMQQLLDMGISKEDAEISLYRCNDNVEEAILFCQEFLCVDYGAMDGSVTLGGGQRPSKLKKFMRKMTTKARKSLTGPSVLFPKSSSSTSHTFNMREPASSSAATSTTSLRRDSFQSSVISDPPSIQRASSQVSAMTTSSQPTNAADTSAADDAEPPPDYMDLFTPPAELGDDDNEMPPGYEDIPAQEMSETGEVIPSAPTEESTVENGHTSDSEQDDPLPAAAVSPRESPRETFIPSMRVLAIPAAEGCNDSDDEASIVSMISAYSKSSKNDADQTHTPSSLMSNEEEVRSELVRLGSGEEIVDTTANDDGDGDDIRNEDGTTIAKIAPTEVLDHDEELWRELEQLAEAEQYANEASEETPALTSLSIPTAIVKEACDPFSPAVAAEDESTQLSSEISAASTQLVPSNEAAVEEISDESAVTTNDKQTERCEEKEENGQIISEVKDEPDAAAESLSEMDDHGAPNAMQFDDEELLRELQSLGMDVDAADDVAAGAVAYDSVNGFDDVAPDAFGDESAVEPAAAVASFNDDGFGNIDSNAFGGEAQAAVAESDGFGEVSASTFGDNSCSAPAVLVAADGFDELPAEVFATNETEDEEFFPMVVEASAPPAFEDLDATSVPSAIVESQPLTADSVVTSPEPLVRVPTPQPATPSVSTTAQRPTPIATPDANDDMRSQSGISSPVVAAVASTVSGEDEDVVVADTLLHVNIDPRTHDAVAGSYLRNEQGECYVTVATLMEDDEERVSSGNSTAAQRAEEEARVQEAIRQRRLQEQSRGLFGYMSTALYGADVGDESMNRGRTARKRVLLSYDVTPSSSGAWIPRITTKQVKLKNKSEGPQGSLSDVVTLPMCATEEQATRLCEATAAPLWAGGSDKKECVICFCTEGIFNKLHHCRNCGYYVCKKCSSKSWPSSMVPTTYINKESYIRVCDSCSCLAEAFVDGLVTGDASKTMAIYSSGNVNLYCPFSIYKSAPYPVHCAAQGGNLDILRWLLEDRMCPIKSRGVGDPLTTTEGMSVFAIAAHYGHVPIMRYVVHRHGAAVTEIAEVSVLHRALHAALEAPGPLPEIVSGGKGILRMKRRAIPRDNATGFDAMDDTIRGLSSRHGTAPPVEAQLATGNRNLEECVTASAEEYNEINLITGPRHKKVHKSSRAPNPAAVDIASNTVRTLLASIPQPDSHTNDNMSVTSGNSINTATASVGAMQSMLQPYRDEDVTILSSRSSHGNADVSPRNGPEQTTGRR